MQDVGNDLRKLDGNGVLGKRIKEVIEPSNHNNWVVDGIRHPDEAEELLKILGFHFIGISAPPEDCLSRILDRKKLSDPTNSMEIVKAIHREWGVDEPDSGQQVAKCMKMVDLLISNTGTKGHIRDIIDNLVLWLKRIEHNAVYDVEYNEYRL
jgi:hypothetical protein